LSPASKVDAMVGKKDEKQSAAPTKQGRFLFSRTKPKADASTAQQAQSTPDSMKSGPQKKTPFSEYVNKQIAKRKDFDLALKEQGIRGGAYNFTKRMVMYAIVIAAIVAVVLAFIFSNLFSTSSGGAVIGLLLGVVTGMAVYMMLLQQFMNFPAQKNKNRGKDIERDILFAARDMVISMRSGMPLFNALAAVSVGYGASSKEFEKIVDLVQLGTPMEQAIDEVSARSASKTFKRLMLQASVSIKAGADIVQALQEVVNEVMQERTIELRRYGQRLNALSMFYLLFGIIFPSMGIAVAAILTTFINIFSINGTILLLVLVFIAILQFVFLNIMRSSRPSFSL
jgi:archaeal flagellar protein FlaJ